MSHFVLARAWCEALSAQLLCRWGVEVGGARANWLLCKRLGAAMRADPVGPSLLVAQFDRGHLLARRIGLPEH